ncbi:MAG: sulfatase-like hydrolase/transferase [Muribaculaceae bacterium]
MKKYAISVPVLAAMMASCAGGDKGDDAKRPNVIVILCDDLGYGDVSAYGSKTISTPNVDSLAHGGVCFNNAYATSATSTPSRYALMTGMYPWKNERAKILNGDAPLLIDPDGYTLPKMMKNAGYVTGAIGKWHLGMGNGDVNWNETIIPGAKEVGFDYSCVIAATVDRVPTVYIENGNVVGREADDPIYVDYNNKFDDEPNALDNPELVRMQWSCGHNQAVINGIPRIGYMKGGKNARWIDEDMADYFVGKVKTFLNDNKDKPFFLYYGLHQPHVPRTPHQRFVGATTMGPRGDVIAELDWCVGELMAELRKLDLLDNTIIVFTSDNGPVLDDGYVDYAVERLGNHQVTGGLRGGKYSLYDGGTHIPFFVYWKGHIEPTTSNALVCQMDLLNTFAALVGQPVRQDLDSKEMLDVFLGKSENGREELVLEAAGRLCFRKGNWALIPPYNGPEFRETELGNLKDFGLFDLSADRGQTTNVADQNPEKLEEMKLSMHEAVHNYYNAVK